MAKSETGTADFQSTIVDMAGFVLTGGADAAVVNLREGSVAGAIRYTVKAAANTTKPLDLPGSVTSQTGAWFVDLVSGTTPQMTIFGG